MSKRRWVRTLVPRLALDGDLDRFMAAALAHRITGGEEGEGKEAKA
jgi:hypothetical protein